MSGTDLLLTGVAFEIVTPGCSLDGVASVRCALAGFTTVTLIGSDLADVIDVSDIGALNVFVAAKDGDDVILGGDGPEILSGGAGDDVFIGGSILNIIFEGSGNNIIIGGRRSDEDPPPDPEPLQPVPEPAVLFIVGLGVSACLARRQRRTSTTQPSLRR